ncbi:SPASM domain-containing protein [Acidisphaera sp. L21]|uniref:SPASM domain-containing protein n=1 Tax=Acidisphaera sp. L21 TaxID=1641851 RepID=UPI00131D631E|nr:SPASM domain-containing protein [Acidisphaera sp. L21]
MVTVATTAAEVYAPALSGGRTPPMAVHNRKNTRPSGGMLPPDGNHYVCPWLDDSLTIHSDGNVSCGLDDPHALRSFGNITTQSVAEIYANPEFGRLRQKLWKGHRCRECSLYRRAGETEAPPRSVRGTLPATVVIETTVRCNLRCPNAACIPNNDPGLRTRDRDDLTMDSLMRAVDEMGQSLRTIYFFNYGDPFVHRDAPAMLTYLRANSPHAQIVTSTNAIPLAPRARAEIVVPCLDQITVTLSGVTQTSYAKYHVNGQVGQALLGLQNLCEVKRALNTTGPRITWRYLLFRWNDSLAEIDAAIGLAKLYGVDDFNLYLTHMPASSSSYRFAPGTLSFTKYRRYIDTVYNFQYSEPNADGFHPLEDIPGMGRARWAGWRSDLRLTRRGHWLSLSLSSTRRAMGEVAGICFIQTAWATYRVTLVSLVWRDVSILVPWELRDLDTHDLQLVTLDEWFPIEDIGTADTRGLGVLVREECDPCLSDRDHASAHLALEMASPDEIRQLSGLLRDVPPLVLHTHGGQAML